MAAQKAAGLAAMLKAAKSHLSSALSSKSPLTVVIGNQSAGMSHIEFPKIVLADETV